MNRLVLILSVLILGLHQKSGCIAQTPNDHLKVLKEEGVAPIAFVKQKLKNHDLILFDDALHNAVEPFDFYRELIKNNTGDFDYIFLEVFGINTQPLIDAFLASETKDPTLLLKAFQDSFAGLGWRYETYYDLLSSVWDFNHSIADTSKRIQVIGVDQPIYWEAIHTRETYNIFQKSLIGRDYFMYKIILDHMEGFEENKKGIFLTNTRHAYKHIKKSDGSFYWNSGTFFNQWHPDKTYSIRIHNVTLSIEAKKKTSENTSTEGMDKLTYRWVKMENGAWDEAFELNENTPVAFSFRNNVFGQAGYVGNHMLNVTKGQTMYDAYDALIFLAPLNELHFSSKIDFIFTSSFKEELKRRIKILYGNDLSKFLSKNEVGTIEEYIEQLSKYQPITKNELINK